MPTSINKPTSYIIGIKAEEAAIKYYESQGFTLLKHRYKTKHGEIDLIFQKDTLILFVEVKARKILEHQELITSKQQVRLYNTALSFISQMNCEKEPDFQFDVYIATKGKEPKIIAQAFDFSQFSA